MVTDIFAEVRSRITAKDAATRYGLEVKRDFTCCPFHGEKTASLHFHDGQFYCFGCHASGSSIDFVALLYGLSPLEAVRRLNEDFSLGLSLDRPATQKEAEAARKRQETDRLYEQFEQWRYDLIRNLNACIRRANGLGIQSLDTLSDAETLALRKRDDLTAWADALANGTAAEQMAVFRERNKVEALTSQILNCIQMR